MVFTKKFSPIRYKSGNFCQKSPQFLLGNVYHYFSCLLSARLNLAIFYTLA